MSEVLCIPKWWDKSIPRSKESSNYKAIRVPKNTDDVKNVFKQKYIDSLPEDWVWKIETHNPIGYIWRSDDEFKKEFDII